VTAPSNREEFRRALSHLVEEVGSGFFWDSCSLTTKKACIALIYNGETYGSVSDFIKSRDGESVVARTAIMERLAKSYPGGGLWNVERALSEPSKNPSRLIVYRGVETSYADLKKQLGPDNTPSKSWLFDHQDCYGFIDYAIHGYPESVPKLWVDRTKKGGALSRKMSYEQRALAKKFAAHLAGPRSSRWMANLDACFTPDEPSCFCGEGITLLEALTRHVPSLDRCWFNQGTDVFCSHLQNWLSEHDFPERDALEPRSILDWYFDLTRVINFALAGFTAPIDHAALDPDEMIDEWYGRLHTCDAKLYFSSFLSMVCANYSLDAILCGALMGAMQFEGFHAHRISFYPGNACPARCIRVSLPSLGGHLLHQPVSADLSEGVFSIDGLAKALSVQRTHLMRNLCAIPYADHAVDLMLSNSVDGYEAAYTERYRPIQADTILRGMFRVDDDLVETAQPAMWYAKRTITAQLPLHALRNKLLFSGLSPEQVFLSVQRRRPHIVGSKKRLRVAVRGHIRKLRPDELGKWAGVPVEDIEREIKRELLKPKTPGLKGDVSYVVARLAGDAWDQPRDSGPVDHSDGSADGVGS
jgi:hypothetical protein